VRLKAAFLAGTTLLLTTQISSAQSFNQALVFGDSTVDAGYYKSLANPGAGATYNSYWGAAVAAGAGAPTTNPGPMNSQFLASYFGLTANPADQAGGTNYATSGAKDVTVNNAQTGGFGAAIPTVTQIANYLAASNGRANGSALYLISSGGNDVSYAVGGSGTGPYPADPAAYLVSAAGSLASSIASLQAAGARYIIVPGLAYSFPTGSGAGNANERQLRFLYTQTLWSTLAANGVQFIPADLNSFRLAVASNPAEFGFTSISNAAGHTACTVPAGLTTAWALLCSSNPAAPSQLVTPNAEQTYLFADDQHFTTAGQKIEADYYDSLITAPSEISYLAEAPLETRAAVISSIDNQIPVSLHQAGQYHAWVSGDLSWLKISNPNPGFPGDPGTPVSATAGFDFRVAPDWLIGAAFSGGTTKQSFSLGGGFTLDEFAVSGYAAYLNGPFWGNAIASAGGLFFDTNRQVPVGITTQPNTGDTKGSNLSLMLESGFTLTSPIGTAGSVMPVKAAPAMLYIMHGPIVGVTLQQVRVDGFTETDQFAAIGGFTALSFLAQIRNSAVTELGYQASVDVGIWHPFAKLVWNHELANTDRQVTALLTTASFAPDYSLPAVVLGRDWGTGTVGTSLKMSRDVTGLATFVSQFAEHNVTNYGGQVGINIALEPAVATDMPVKAPILK
jgi:outer membrane lipase/esterase